jgi:hypothetical protein
MKLRDVFRPCVSDDDFASIFDLANPTELAAAIDDDVRVTAQTNTRVQRLHFRHRVGLRNG